MRAKRLFDVGATIAGLFVLWPVLLIVALLIKLDDGGSVFFRQERVGHAGRRFRVWKFRTMIPDAERRGGALTVGQDPRTTRVGRWLRRSKLDELPQLFNVLAGDMSLVGPRPEVPRYVALLGRPTSRPGPGAGHHGSGEYRVSTRERATRARAGPGALLRHGRHARQDPDQSDVRRARHPMDGLEGRARDARSSASTAREAARLSRPRLETQGAGGDS